MMYFNRICSLAMPGISIKGKVSRIAGGRVATLALISLFAFLSGLLSLSGCAERPLSDLEKGLGFYRQNQLEKARPLFESAVEKDSDNPEAYAWLAETFRRLGQIDTAIVIARKAIEIDSCNSFAHTLLAHAYNPMYSSREGTDKDSTWRHLMLAVACDSSDGNAWLAIWTEAILRGDSGLESKALHFLVKTKFLTPAILSYNRWMLRHVPEKAVLLTNGDMDTYPAVAIQEVEGFREDVAIVNYSLLNITKYAKFVRDKYGIQLPFTDSELEALRPHKDKDGKLVTIAHQIMRGWLGQIKQGAFDRPVAISTTVANLSFADDAEDHLQLMGPFRLWLAEPPESPMDTTMIRLSLASINPDDFAGPLVSNDDRSAVRLSFTNRIVTNITQLALDYSKALIKAKRASEAYEMLNWAEQFERKTKVGPVLSEEIGQLKVSARQEME